MQCRDFTLALHMENTISPLFPGPRGTWLLMTGALISFDDGNDKKTLNKHSYTEKKI